jgi:hypothetical protein
MVSDEIKALRELLAKATPRPWRDVSNPHWSQGNHQVRADGLDYGCFGEVAFASPADAALAVAAINALSGLLDTAETARAADAENVRLRGLVAKLTEERDAGWVHPEEVKAEINALQDENDKLRDLVGEAVELLRDVSRYAVSGEVNCRGDKCREDNCSACNDEDSVYTAVAARIKRMRECNAFLARIAKETT